MGADVGPSLGWLTDWQGLGMPPPTMCGDRSGAGMIATDLARHQQIRERVSVKGLKKELQGFS